MTKDLNYLDTARSHAKAHLLSSPTRGPDSLGFLLGGSGIFALNAALAKMSGNTHPTLLALTVIILFEQATH